MHASGECTLEAKGSMKDHKSSKAILFENIIRLSVIHTLSLDEMIKATIVLS